MNTIHNPHPWDDSVCAADAARITRQWRRDGFIVVRSFFSSDEMEQLSAEAWRLTQRTDLINELNLRCRYQPAEDGAAPLWETFDPIVDISPLCRHFAHDSRLLQLLQRIYGEPPCLFKDKLIFKPAGAQGYALHQDWIAWPDFPRSFLTVLIPIDPATERNGCTEVFPGRHREGPLSPGDGNYHALTEDAVDLASGVKLILDPGDVAVFDGFTPHQSAANQSNAWRRQLYLSYNAHSDGGDQRDSHYHAFHEYLTARCRERGVSNVYFR